MTFFGHQVAPEKSNARVVIRGEKIFITFSNVVLCALIVLRRSIQNYLERKLILNRRDVFEEKRRLGRVIMALLFYLELPI
jgi:hypothetical protein